MPPLLCSHTRVTSLSMHKFMTSGSERQQKEGTEGSPEIRVEHAEGSPEVPVEHAEGSPENKKNEREKERGRDFRKRGAVAHACNPSSLGGRVWGGGSQGQEFKTRLASMHFGRPRQTENHLSSGVQDQPGQHGETPSLLKKIQKVSQVWLQVPVVPATWKAEARELLEPRRRLLSENAMFLPLLTLNVLFPDLATVKVKGILQTPTQNPLLFEALLDHAAESRCSRCFQSHAPCISHSSIALEESGWGPGAARRQGLCLMCHPTPAPRDEPAESRAVGTSQWEAGKIKRRMPTKCSLCPEKLQSSRVPAKASSKANLSLELSGLEIAVCLSQLQHLIEESVEPSH
ncbi:hypothetical protein AAY473_004875 [Plecturocebus cupreus]